MRKKFGRLKGITKTTLKKLPQDKPGVYGIFDKKGKVQKVGRAKKGRISERIVESAEEIKKKRGKANKFGFIPTKTVEEAKKLETKLIKIRKPKFNIEKKGK